MRNNSDDKKSYAEKLKDPQWQKKRLEILQLHKFKCDTCKDDKTELHVHHRFYLKGRNPWQYDNDVFQVLCSSCHEKIHQKQDLQPKIIEVIPEKYKDIINTIESCVDFDDRIIDNLNELLIYLLEEDRLGFISNMGALFNYGEADLIITQASHIFNAETSIRELRFSLNETIKFINNSINGKEIH